MAEVVTCHSLADPGRFRRISHGSLNDCFVQMMTSLLPVPSFHRLVAGKTQCYRQSRAAEGST